MRMEDGDHEDASDDKVKNVYCVDELKRQAIGMGILPRSRQCHKSALVRL